MSYFYLTIAVLLISSGQVLQKLAARQLDTGKGAVAALVSLFRNAYFWLAVSVMALGVVAWLLALSGLDVSRAYPILGMSFVLTAAFSARWLGEEVGYSGWIGVCLISIGAAIMVSS